MKSHLWGVLLLHVKWEDWGEGGKGDPQAGEITLRNMSWDGGHNWGLVGRIFKRAEGISRGSGGKNEGRGRNGGS